jgi:hypothetical protein
MSTDSQILKGMKMKNKIENMAYEKIAKRNDEELYGLSKEEKRKILLDRLHKKTKRQGGQQERFKDLSEALQNDAPAGLDLNSISKEEKNKRNQAKRRKIKKIKKQIQQRFAGQSIPETNYLESLERVKSDIEQNKLYHSTLIELYERRLSNNPSIQTEDDLEFD